MTDLKHLVITVFDFQKCFGPVEESPNNIMLIVHCSAQKKLLLPLSQTTVISCYLNVKLVMIG